MEDITVQKRDARYCECRGYGHPRCIYSYLDITLKSVPHPARSRATAVTKPEPLTVRPSLPRTPSRAYDGISISVIFRHCITWRNFRRFISGGRGSKGWTRCGDGRKRCALHSCSDFELGLRPQLDRSREQSVIEVG